jgi:hypothetical protein
MTTTHCTVFDTGARVRFNGLIAFVVNQNSTSTPTQLQEMKEAAQAIAQPLLILNAANESEIDEAFATMSREKVAAVVFGAHVFYQVVRSRLRHNIVFRPCTNGVSS